MPDVSGDLAFRGLLHQVTDPSVLRLLDEDRVTLYYGFDPTAPSLHVGNLVQLCMLRRLQLAGHRPIALAGGGTGLIGDPGGKSAERPLLSVEEIRANVAGQRPQLERFIDFAAGAGVSRAVAVDNGDWLGRLRLVDFLRDTGKHFTVNQMVAKESVRTRLERPEHGISYTEFSYMLLQAYDYLHLYDHFGCQLQIGGSDQWGNITAGIELVHKVRRSEVYGLTTPLLLRSDGEKFGKTESETIWLDAKLTSPYQLYQFFLRVEDAMAGRYLRYLTFLDHATIVDLEEATAARPEQRRAQRALAHEVCVLVHGDLEASRAETAAAALYTGALSTLDESALLAVFDDVPASTWPRAELDGNGIPLVDAMARSGLVKSKSSARTTITQGGAYVNDRRAEELDARVRRSDLLFDRYLVLRRGKQDYHLVRFE